VKCPHKDCGAWTSVLSTRDGVRRRLCANNHRFTTREALDKPPLPAAVTQPVARRAERRV